MVRKVTSSLDMPLAMKEEEFLNLPFNHIITNMVPGVLYRYNKSNDGEGICIIKFDNSVETFDIRTVKLIKGINGD